MTTIPYLEFEKVTHNCSKLKGGRVPLVYFFIAETGMVLYVGKTDKFAARWKQHIMSDKAMHLVHRVELHVMESQAESVFYETEMILKYAPLWNSIGRHATPSKFSVYPCEILHYKSTACARYVLPYARYGHACYDVKHREVGKNVVVTIGYKGDHIGTIKIANDLSEITSDAGIDCNYYNRLVERMEYCAEIGKKAYDILYDEIGFIPAIVPDAVTKCNWHGAIHRERIQDWSDDSEWYETGIVNVLPSVDDFLSELEYVPDICTWYTVD